MNIILERGKIWSLEELPPYSIALDGAVQGPKIDMEQRRYSFDHHAGCMRFCTVSSTYQVWMAILLGLDPAKIKQVYINDVDLDVSGAFFCLKNPDRCSEPKVKRLVESISLGDMHAGAIPLNEMSKVINWISSPQTESIRNGDYHKISNEGLLTILESTLHRIDKYIDDKASVEIAEQELFSDFEIKKNENGWVLVESLNPYIYTFLYRAGFDRIVLVRPQDDGSNAISLAKRSDFIDNFPLEKIYNEFNKLEPGWGGGTSVGGSPRNDDGSRSRLPLSTIVEVVNACVEGREPDVKKTTKKKTTKKVSKKNA